MVRTEKNREMEEGGRVYETEAKGEMTISRGLWGNGQKLQGVQGWTSAYWILLMVSLWPWWEHFQPGGGEAWLQWVEEWVMEERGRQWAQTKNFFSWELGLEITFLFYLFIYFLKYSWFTVLCQFQIYSKVFQLYIHIGLAKKNLFFPEDGTKTQMNFLASPAYLYLHLYILFQIFSL